MNSISYLKKDHKEILNSLFEFEEAVNNKDIDYWNLIYAFHKLSDLLLQHEQNERFVFKGISRNRSIKIPVSKIFLDPRRVKGHIRVINGAILSKDVQLLKVALENDGRMFISRVKEHISGEKKIFGGAISPHTAS